MNKPIKIDDFAVRLRQIVELTTNPAAAREAKQLILRLNTPVRVVLLGLPGSGKLGLLNALVPGPALPEAATDTTVEVRYGRFEAAEITFSDGSVAQQEGPLEADDLSEAALIVVERPLPELRTTNLLNLVASADPAEQQAAIDWVARRTDIAIWCTRTFSRGDQTIWANVPDRIKDHAYLVLTGCDDERAGLIKTRFREDFLDVYAVDLGGPEETGLAELAGRIARHVELGRRADMDSALLFLKSQMPRERTKPRPNTRPVSKPAPAAPVAAPPTPLPAALPEPVAAVETPRAAVNSKTPGVPKTSCSAGFTFLRDRGLALLHAVRAVDGMTDRDVLSHCSETLSNLSDLMLSHDEHADSAELADTVMEAESLVVLLESEGAAEAALEAVSILLQVRRDFELSLAA